jgi:hypothetical protein
LRWLEGSRIGAGLCLVGDISNVLSSVEAKCCVCKQLKMRKTTPKPLAIDMVISQLERGFMTVAVTEGGHSDSASQPAIWRTDSIMRL